jgi:hydroxymethylpyrimidine pyrophosphatase-like HAD family hydrolase
MTGYRPQRGAFDAVLCDIDGCLAPEDGGPMDLSSLARIAAHNQRAVRTGDWPVVTLCSGRPITFVEAMCRVVANTTLPAIGEMGVWLYDPTTQQMEQDPAITPEQSLAVAEASRWIDAQFGRRAGPGVMQQPGKSSSISLYHPDTPYLMSLIPQLRAQIESSGWGLRVSNTWLWINCDLAHVSKATGIDRFIARTGIPPERLAGIGDTMGDMAIRERVAWFGCPANASRELKPHADFVSEHKEVEGVLDILGKLMEDAPRGA